MARIWERVNKDGPIPEARPDLGPCWIWTAGRDGHGYASMRINNEHIRPYRVLYEALIGPIPAGKEPDHLCRVRACVRPSHIEPVSHRENMLRSETTASGRNIRKTHCPRGHALEGDNLLQYKLPWRICRVCKNLRRRIARTAAA